MTRNLTLLEFAGTFVPGVCFLLGLSYLILGSNTLKTLSDNSTVVIATILVTGYALGHLLNGFAYGWDELRRKVWPFSKNWPKPKRDRVSQIIASTEEIEAQLIKDTIEAMPPKLKNWLGDSTPTTGRLWGVARPFVLSRDLGKLTTEIERNRSVVSLSFGMQRCAALLMTCVLLKWSLLLLPEYSDARSEGLGNFLFFIGLIFIYFASISRYQTSEGALRRDVLLATHLEEVKEFKYPSKS